MSLKYHAQTAALLDEAPVFSVEAAESLSRAEEAFGFRFPESVREWYSLRDAATILERYSRADTVISVDKLGEPFDSFDMVKQDLLVFRIENQGVCSWAVKLNAGEDPPVVIAFGGEWDEWQPAADSFSTFVYCCVWDGTPGVPGPDPESVAAQDQPLTDADLAWLQNHFEEAPRTYGFPGNTQYRFRLADQTILIWADENGADWYLSAGSRDSLLALLKYVWHCGTLSQTLYECNPGLQHVLNQCKRAAAKSGQEGPQ